jgi:hypothetical protein
MVGWNAAAARATAAMHQLANIAAMGCVCLPYSRRIGIRGQGLGKLDSGCIASRRDRALRAHRAGREHRRRHDIQEQQNSSNATRQAKPAQPPGMSGRGNAFSNCAFLGRERMGLMRGP